MTLNQTLISNNVPSLQELHINSFTNNNYHFDTFNIKPIYSFYFPIIKSKEEQIVCKDEVIEIYTPDSRHSKFNNEYLYIKIFTDNSKSVKNYEIGSHPFLLLSNKALLNRTIMGTHVLSKIFEDFQNDKSLAFNNIKRNDIENLAKLKFNLLLKGVKFSKKALLKLLKNRKVITIRDGIAGGLDIKLFEDIYINVPIKEWFSYISPFIIDYSEKKGFILSYNNKLKINIEILTQPSFVGKLTQKGVKMEIVGQFFTDRLSIAPFYFCKYNNLNKQSCKFCEIGNSDSTGITNIEDLNDLFNYINKNNDINLRHILISGGSPKNDTAEGEHFITIIKYIRQITHLKIYLMIEPPNDLNKLDLLYQIGINEIAFNLEVFDRNIAKKIMPGKGQIPLSKYEECFYKAVKLWGTSGNIRSVFIAGLEPYDNLLKGVEFVAKIGVMPILSPFRPVPNTPLEYHMIPDVNDLYYVWKNAQKITEKYNLTLGPLCVCCQNNTLALPINDKYYKY